MTTQPAQCGRTFIHLPHETDTGSGQCPGLDGTEVARGAQCVEPGCEDDHATDLRSRIRHALDWSPVDHIVTKTTAEELTNHLMRHLDPTEVPVLVIPLSEARAAVEFDDSCGEAVTTTASLVYEALRAYDEVPRG